MTSRTLPIFALICALLWGSAFPGIKFVYGEWGEGATAGVRLAFAGVRFMLAGLILAALRGNPLRAVSGATWRPLLALALTQTFLQYLLFYNGLAVSGGVLGSLIVSAGSFWWVLLAPPVLKTAPPTRFQWAMLAACAGGMALAVWRPGAGAGDPVAGAALFLGSSLAGAMAVIVMRGWLEGVRASHATALSLFAGGFGLAVCGAGSMAEFFRLLDPVTGAATVYLAGVSATAFTLWNSLVQKFSANTLAGYRFLIPLCGLILSAALIPGESVGVGALAGGAVVIGSIIALQRARPAAPMPSPRP